MDAVDKAFFRALKKYPRAKALLAQFKCISFTPFDPVSKQVVAVVESPDGEQMTCVKGAPFTVLKMVECDNTTTPEALPEFRKKIVKFSARGFRSLAIARKNDKSSDWELMGIVPLHDPPHYDTGRTMNEARLLGLSIKMLTGDAVEIAAETSRQLGLGTNILSAEELNVVGDGHLPESPVYDFVESAAGFAEVFPQHKYDVVRILQNRGYLVAMTGDGVNDAPSMKKADTGIAVQGSSDAARSAADIVFLAPGLSAIIDAVKVSRQIFHRMHSYVIYRIALSLHLEMFFASWIIAFSKTLDLQLVVFIAIFADLATLAIAYDTAPHLSMPVKWNLRKVWCLSIILGLILAAGTCIALSTILASPSAQQGTIEGQGNIDTVVFLQICLTENWLIFITRCDGPFWSTLPSWQLSGAILLVDVLATLFCVFGWFVGGKRTSLVTVARVWAYSFGIFCVMAGAYYLLQNWSWINPTDDVRVGRTCLPSEVKIRGRPLDQATPPRQRATSHLEMGH